MESLQALNTQQKLSVWGERIAACRQSGGTVQAWCRENGIHTGTYYKWQRRLFAIATEQTPQFVEVAPRPQRKSVALLRMGGAEVELSVGIDEETLGTICRVLRTC